MSKMDTLLMNLDVASESIKRDYEQYKNGEISKDVVESRIDVIRSICDKIEKRM